LDKIAIVHPILNGLKKSFEENDAEFSYALESKLI